jgi:hypothetical protein
MSLRKYAVKRVFTKPLVFSLGLALFALSWPIIPASAGTSPISTLIQTSVNCNGNTITALQPSPGGVMPISALTGLPATSVPTQLQSTSMNWIVPQCTLGHPSSGGPTVPSGVVPTNNIPSSGNQPYLNWSGFEAETHVYSVVDLGWTVPRVTYPGSGSNPLSAIWDGLGYGSTNSNMLVQAGTEQDASSPSSYYVWFMLLPMELQQQVLSNFPINPGDSMFVSVSHSGSGVASFSISDLTSGMGTAFNEVWGSQYTIGTQANWILERTQVGSNYQQLANVGTVPFNSAYASYGGTPYALGSLNRYYSYMWACGYSSYIAKTGSLDSSGTAFPITWYGYGGICS